MTTGAPPPSPRVLVIGLDGATWVILKPLMDQGLLPNLKRLVERGAAGDLESTVPAHSGPAWTTFMTGVNPGKHGIFGFLKTGSDGEPTFRPVSSRDIRTPTIFHLLSQQQRVVCSVNVPITYPPMDINGCMVSDDLLRPREGVFTHPADLFARLQWDPTDGLQAGRLRLKSKSPSELINEHVKLAGVRAELSLRLMAAYDWDFFTVVFTETDRLQHYFWHELDPRHSKHNRTCASGLREELIRFYQAIDQHVGRLVECAGENTWVLVVSDHGFGPYEHHLAVNRLLHQHGLLTLNSRRLARFQSRVRGFLHRHSPIYRRLKTFVKASKGKATNGSTENMRDEDVIGAGTFFSKTVSMINWGKTSAYFLGDTGAVVHVNLKSREPHGCIPPDAYETVRNRVMELLSGLRDPVTGKLVALNPRRKEDLYHGPAVGEAPDILCDNRSSCKLIGPLAEEIFVPSKHYTGWHLPEGIFVLAGPGIQEEKALTGARILDIAPTVLHLLGLPVPEHMDGRVLVEAFEENYLDLHPVRSAEAMVPGGLQMTQNVYSEEEAAKIEQRLGDLGYLE